MSFPGSASSGIGFIGLHVYMAGKHRAAMVHQNIADCSAVELMAWARGLKNHCKGLLKWEDCYFRLCYDKCLSWRRQPYVAFAVQPTRIWVLTRIARRVCPILPRTRLSR